MRVTDVQISDVAFDAQSNAHYAQIVLSMSQNNGAQYSDGYYLARAELPQNSDLGYVRQALIDDALRQARRMPEFRGGADVLSLEAEYEPMVA